MKQLTFNDIHKEVQLTQKDRRVLSLLKADNTQSQISRKAKVAKSTVCQIVRKLEKARLIRKKWAGNHNIIYVLVKVVNQNDTN